MKTMTRELARRSSHTSINLAKWSLMAAATLMAALTLAQPAKASENTLTAMDYSTLPGDQVRVTLTLDQPATQPRAFTIDNPARIALDLAGTRNRLSERGLQVGVGAVEGISTAEAGGRTRVVIRLAQMVSYDVSTDGNQLHILLSGDAARTGQATPRTGVTPVSTRQASSVGVTDIDFRRAPDGSGRVLLDLADPGLSVAVREEGGRIIANVLNTRLPERLQRRLDVTDFGTPVTTIDARQAGDNVRLVISAEGTFEHMAYQTGDQLSIEVKALTPEEREERDRQEFTYTGERLSLNFQDIELRSVLQLIADFTNLNVVVNDSVTGSITLRLQNVPWDQALDIILRSKGLDKRQVGNVIMVGPAEQIAARERQELESRQQIETLAPLRSDFLQVNYARAEELAQLIRSGDTSLLSERGTVTIDQRTNTLIVQDTEQNLSNIRNLVTRLDIPVRQVLIESRIVIATDDFTRDLGVRFGGSGQDLDGDDFIRGGGTRPGNLALTPNAVPGQGMLVDLPAPAAAGSVGLAVGTMGSHVLQLELSAMETEGRGDIVSSPRVITANQQEATIEQGVEIPFQQATASGATSVEFKKAVLGLTVTPQITPDDRILLNLGVSKDSMGVATPAGPAINTQSVTTQVLVDNGETVVLGGVYERTNSQDVRRVPFFGELPLLGALFRSTNKVDNRSELLIFVTPKILQESLRVN